MGDFDLLGHLQVALPFARDPAASPTAARNGPNTPLRPSTAEPRSPAAYSAMSGGSTGSKVLKLKASPMTKLQRRASAEFHLNPASPEARALAAEAFKSHEYGVHHSGEHIHDEHCGHQHPATNPGYHLERAPSMDSVSSGRSSGTEDEISGYKFAKKGLLCDLCINGQMIHDKAERLRQAREEEKEKIRARQEMAAIQKEHDDRAAREAAQRKAAEMANCYRDHVQHKESEKEAERAANAEIQRQLAERQHSTADAARTRQAAKSQQYRAELEAQIQADKAKKEAERVAYIGQKPASPAAELIDAKAIRDHKMEKYREELKAQIERRRDEAMAERVADRQRLAAVRERNEAEARERAQRYLDAQTRSRQELEREFQRHSAQKETLRQRKMREQAEEIERVRATQARAAAELAQSASQRVHKERSFADELRAQIDAKHAREQREKELDRQQFGSPNRTPTHTHSNLLSCRGCRRPLPKTRFSPNPRVTSPWMYK